MIIDIADDLTPQERKDLLIVLPTDYALSKCRTQTEAAKFLGISSRNLRYRICKYQSLHKYRNKKLLPDHIARYDKKHLWGQYERE